MGGKGGGGEKTALNNHYGKPFSRFALYLGPPREGARSKGLRDKRFLAHVQDFFFSITNTWLRRVVAIKVGA